MTWEAQNPEQAQVVATEAELTVVLGGAGVGKTTSALAAAAAFAPHPAHGCADPCADRRSDPDAGGPDRRRHRAAGPCDADHDHARP